MARRTVHGGLEIVPLPRVPCSDADYGLIHSRFNTTRLAVHLMEEANEILEYLNQKEPLGLFAYAKKQKAYNRLLMLYDQISSEENKTGPHTVKLCSRSRNGTLVFGVQLSIDYCERNSNDIKASPVIVLEPYQQQVTTVPQQNYEPYYKGRVIFIEEKEQMVHFLPFYRTMPEGHYMVRFLPSQFVYNSRNHIMNELQDNERPYRFLVFPPPLDENLTTEQYLGLRDKAISKCEFSSECYNLEQRQAIVAIFNALSFNISSANGNMLPFVLHGPPGTGKTTTLVEACRLLVKENDKGRILVCTPSNTAADLFAYELVHTAGLEPSAVFRMYALTHPTSELNDALKDIAFVKPNGEMVDQFGIPPAVQMMKYRIVVCTLLCSMYLALGGMKHQFGHIIIDEAGQASELDTLVPIVGLLGGNNTKVVLAGDPHQLGPVEMVDYFKKIGISSSLIERYEANPNYKNDPRIVTMLRANYRSHASIIAVPSRLFYNNELYVPEDAQPRDALATWKALPKQGFPILWHHVNEPEEKEMDGHSYANKGEQEVVLDYIKRICTELHVKPSNIGVVTPYNYQMRQLRNKLGIEHKEVTVDTVERYQGSQRRVIIVSTVRNNEKEAIGFLMSDKRFNTVVTRAEELLIIVGNAKVMMRDPSWKEMVDYCRRNEGTVNMPSEAELFPMVGLQNGVASTNSEENESEVSEDDTEEEEEDNEEETDEEEEDDDDVDGSSSDGEDEFFSDNDGE